MSSTWNMSMTVGVSFKLEQSISQEFSYFLLCPNKYKGDKSNQWQTWPLKSPVADYMPDLIGTPAIVVENSRKFK
jgi:hypothetical protein